MELTVAKGTSCWEGGGGNDCGFGEGVELVCADRSQIKGQKLKDMLKCYV